MTIKILFTRKALLPKAAAALLAAIVILEIINPGPLFSQSWAPGSWQPVPFGQESWEAGRRVLDYQFDRADRELSPGRWMEEARRGISAAMSVWEEMTWAGFTDPDVRAEMVQWSEAELENRFTRWLMERFFGPGMEAGSNAVFRETGEADKYLVYYTGPGGNVLFDPSTGDPLVIRPGDEGHDFTEDLFTWKQQTSDTAGREIGNYSELIGKYYPELTMYVSPEKLAAAGEFSAQSLMREFEAVLAREERYFSARRLGDVYSRRKKSEESSAAAVGEKLIEEARRICDDGLSSIEAKIEAAKAGGGDLILAGDNWLLEYREQFNRGIIAWEAAEERFLVRRVEWENSAEKAFNDGWEAWNAVFARFDEERRLWEERARELFLEGENFFARASDTLEAAIAAARIEYERESGIRIGAASERTEALAGMFVLSSAAAREAEKNIDFWIDRYQTIYSGLVIPSGYTELGAWIDRELSGQTGTDRDLERLILNELKTWLGLYSNYTAKASETRELLDKELYFLKDSADPYETEIARLKGELDYWEQRANLSEAVVAYAEALDSGRITASESALAWEKARLAYNEAAALYGEAESRLKAGGDEIAAAREALAQTAKNMMEAEESLEKLRRNYENLVFTFGDRGIGLIGEEAAYLREALSLEQELLGSIGDDSPWGKFLVCARELETRQLDELRKGILRLLISGNGDSLPALANLAGDELKPRLAMISLLIEKNSTTDWYRNFSGYGTEGLFPIANVEEQLLFDWERSRLELFAARAELELGVLDSLEGKAAEGEAALVSLYSGDELKRVFDRSVLNDVMELVTYLQEVTNNYGPGYLQEFLVQASLLNTSILPFLSGASQIFYDAGLAAGQESGAEIINALLSGFYDRVEYCGTLYDVYEEFGDLSPAAIAEKTATGLDQLGRLWEILEIDTGSSLFPDTEKIVNALTKLDGDLSGAPALVFILDEIFSLFPSWLEINYFLWKESLAEYNASVSARYAFLLNDLLVTLSNNTGMPGARDFETAAAGYLSNPLLEWNGYYFEDEEITGFNDYENLLGDLANHISREKYLMDELDRLGALLDMAEQGKDKIEHELEQLLAAISRAEETREKYISDYRIAEENYLNAGTAYDSLYASAEKAFQNLEDSRRVFETQDALRLWAETPYLDSRRPEEDLILAREKTEKTRNILTLLESINPEGNWPPDYTTALKNYRESLELYTLSLDAYHKIEQAIASEQERNISAYQLYQGQLSLFGKAIAPEEFGISPDDKSLWTILDIITVENGILVFARDKNNVLSGSDEERMEKLREYFIPNQYIDGEIYPVSSFELALRELANNLNTQSMTLNEYRNLGLARDYLMRNLILNNPDIDAIQGKYETSEQLKKNQNLGSRRIPGGKYVYEVANSTLNVLENTDQPKAWNSLSAEAKMNLEFYTILTLFSSGGINSEYFSRVTESQELNDVRMYIDIVISMLNSLRGPQISAVRSDLKIAKEIYSSISPTTNKVNGYISEGHTGLKETILSMDQKLLLYRESSGKLALLMGGNNGPSGWKDIEKALVCAGGISGDLNLLKGYWDTLSQEYGIYAYDNLDALRILAEACGNLKNENALLLSQVWNTLENERVGLETAYRECYDSYLSGNADITELNDLAALCFSGISHKEHSVNIGNILLETMDGFFERGLSRTPEYSMLAEEFTGLVSRAWEEKYAAGLKIRENEWALRRMDIEEKHAMWSESAALILENGRLAWKEGGEKIRDAYNVWVRSFREEHERISDQWTAAFLEGLCDKEEWAASALAAFSQGSSAAMIALVGSGAEAGSRAMDTRDPVGLFFRDNVPDAGEGSRILAELLEKTGTGYLNSAFASIMASGDSISTVVRSGIGGGIWDSCLSEASALARTIREEFETRESGKMAFSIMNTAREAYKALEENLRLANKEVDKNMDETFIVGGQWRRSGSYYQKDVVVHSTFVNSVITEPAIVERYRNYLLPNTNLAGYLYGDLPSAMSAYEADEIMNALYAEIAALGIKVFGSETDGITGEFYVHLGKPPTPQEKPDPEKGRRGVLKDFGEMESGRLLTEFYFWMCKEGLGISMMNQPPWDKPLWDDRDSAINAPSLRSAVDFALKTGLMIAGAAGAIFTGGTSLIGSIMLNAALNSADDLLFSALDVTYGYKTWGEAGVNFGKALLKNTVDAAASSFFYGVKGFESSSFFGKGGFSGLVNGGGIGGLTFKTVTSGLYTATTGTMNSAISSINYSSSGGFSFSGDNFIDGLKNSAKFSLSSMTGTLTNTILDTGLLGFTGSLYRDGGKLNSLVGGLATQGVNYAFGDDFTLNILNAGLFSSNDRVNAGLMELHLGRNGTSIQLGGGGADASIGALWSAVKGLETWGVNAQLFLSAGEAAHKYTKEMRVLYSEKGVTRDEYRNVLAGRTVYTENYASEWTQSIYDSNTGVKTVLLGSRALEDKSLFGLGVVFSHESYRDGIIGTREEQIAETRNAWLGHNKTANEIISTYGRESLGNSMVFEAGVYNAAMTTGNFDIVNRILSTYDYSADYWMLTAAGSLAYDGLATLKDANGNVIRSAASMGLTDNMVEGALVTILGFSRSDSSAVAFVRNMMEEAGLKHSDSDDPDQWYWKGTHDAYLGDPENSPLSRNVDLTEYNKGVTISISEISQMYAMYNVNGDSSGAMNSFINETYGSAIGFLNYSNNDTTRRMLESVYNETQYQMILDNYSLYTYFLNYGVNVESMFSGNPIRTMEFGEILEVIRVNDPKKPERKFFNELHTGIDLVAALGSLINLPGGYWTLISNDKHSAVYQLIGSDLNMRFQHIDKDVIGKLVTGTVYGGNDSTILPYPTGSPGASTGTHVHVDLTRNLPNGKDYSRQFVNPATFMPDNQFKYWYNYFDINKLRMPGDSGYFKLY